MSDEINLEATWTPVIRLREFLGSCAANSCVDRAQYGAALYISGPMRYMTEAMLEDRVVLKKMFWCAVHKPARGVGDDPSVGSLGELGLVPG
jgi:hypothetical protein